MKITFKARFRHFKVNKWDDDDDDGDSSSIKEISGTILVEQQAFANVASSIAYYMHGKMYRFVCI